MINHTTPHPSLGVWFPQVTYNTLNGLWLKKVKRDSENPLIFSDLQRAKARAYLIRRSMEILAMGYAAPTKCDRCAAKVGGAL